MGNWAEEELGGANLGDARLNRRLVRLATRFAEQPTASIPNACGDWAETMAAYRFFDQASEKKRSLSWQAILQPHIDCSLARMAQHPGRARAALGRHGEGHECAARAGHRGTGAAVL